MTGDSGSHPISRGERAARLALGMPAHHPERITRKPSRAEWRKLATLCAELWPHDEYTAIVAETRPSDRDHEHPGEERPGDD